MTKEAISIVQEDIAKDLSEIAACHQEEVNRLMQEFNKHDIDTTVQFEAYEAERQRQTPGLIAPDTATTSCTSLTRPFDSKDTQTRTGQATKRTDDPHLDSSFPSVVERSPRAVRSSR